MYNNNNMKNKKSQEEIEKNLKKITGKKKQSEFYSECFERAGKKKKGGKMKDCGSFLEFWTHMETDKTHLHRANFCKLRMCPLCAERRSDKLFLECRKMYSIILQRYHYKFLFVTLTVPNCSALELGDTITNILQAFNRMFNWGKISKTVCGYWRTLEVTYNQMSDTYHPHIHVVCAVPPHYFLDPKLFVSADELREDWRHYTKNEKVREIRVDCINKIDYKTICETTKYTFKSFELVVYDNNGEINKDKSAEVVNVMDNALRGRHLVGVGGIFKIVRSQLAKEPLTDSSEDEVLNELDFIVRRFCWNSGATKYIEM